MFPPIFKLFFPPHPILFFIQPTAKNDKYRMKQEKKIKAMNTCFKYYLRKQKIQNKTQEKNIKPPSVILWIHPSAPCWGPGRLPCTQRPPCPLTSPGVWLMWVRLEHLFPCGLLPSGWAPWVKGTVLLSSPLNIVLPLQAQEIIPSPNSYWCRLGMGSTLRLSLANSSITYSPPISWRVPSYFCWNPW